MASINPIEVEIRTRVVHEQEPHWLERALDAVLYLLGWLIVGCAMIYGVALHEYAHATFLIAVVLVMRSYFPSPEQTNG